MAIFGCMEKRMEVYVDDGLVESGLQTSEEFHEKQEQDG